MAELFQLAIKNPLAAITSALCGAVIFTTLGLFEVKETIAGIKEQNTVSEQTNDRVFKMVEQLGRIEGMVQDLHKK
jgi:hypothetical protein